MPENSSIVIQRDKPSIVTITLNRPEKRNALNFEVFQALLKTVRKIKKDSTIKAVIIRGAGTRAFSAGLDLKDKKIRELFAKSRGRTRKEKIKKAILTLRKPLDELWSLDVPVICAVNGYCLGGGMEIALCADIRISNLRAEFGLPEVALGFIPDLGGTQRLQAVTGTGIARYIILTAKRISARDAHLMGIVNEVVNEEDCYPRALEIANDIASLPHHSVKMAKKALRESCELLIKKGLQIELNCAVEAVLHHPLLKNFL